jgi:hypothetical protein
MRQLLITANVGLSSPILITLMMEAICSSQMLVLIRATQRNIPEDHILHIIFEFAIIWKGLRNNPLRYCVYGKIQFWCHYKKITV